MKAQGAALGENDRHSIEPCKGALNPGNQHSMAGTLEITDDLCWTPAGWAYDGALEGIAESVSMQLGDRLRKSMTAVNGGYLDFRDADDQLVRELLGGLDKVLAKVAAAGPNRMHDPAFYEAYVSQLEQLSVLLSQRIGE